MMLVFTPLINDLIPLIHTAVVVSEVSFFAQDNQAFYAFHHKRAMVFFVLPGEYHLGPN